MTPTEKHRETAKELATRIAGGVLNNDDAAYVERYGFRWIEEALAKEFSEGMKRAIAINVAVATEDQPLEFSLALAKASIEIAKEIHNSRAFPSVGPADTAGGVTPLASSAPIPHPAQYLPSEQAIASAGADIAAASPFYSED